MSRRLEALAPDEEAIGRAEGEQLANRGRSTVPIETQIVCGRAGDELAAIAAAERSGLLITALRDRRGWFGARRGSVSYHLLTHAAAPVLACPPNWRPL